MTVAMTKVITYTRKILLLQERVRYGDISYETSQLSVIDYLCFIAKASASNIVQKHKRQNFERIVEINLQLDLMSLKVISNLNISVILQLIL